MRLTSPFSAVLRWLRDIPVMWSLAAIKAHMAEARAEASLGMNAGDAAVMAVGAFALLFVVAVTQVEASPDLSAQIDANTSQPPACTKGVQQLGEADSPQAPSHLVKRCGPWV
jgi:hypothetical protein